MKTAVSLQIKTRLVTGNKKTFRIPPLEDMLSDLDTYKHQNRRGSGPERVQTKTFHNRYRERKQFLGLLKSVTVLGDFSYQVAVIFICQVLSFD